MTSKDFLDFLGKTPDALVKFLDIINEFYKIQGEPPIIKNNAEGPKEWKAGETPELSTVGLSHDDLDALAKGYAEAIKKEKAIEFIKGFITGIMMVA